ncbi:MAG TPA: hypothetical protein EYP87_08310 [Flavobacteriaceae bacterium]|nr:hypothetical protein [Flavobacteriaceae bacterium]
MEKKLLTIWHNPNCSKSREAYTILEMNSEPMVSFDYIYHDLSKEDIYDVMKKLSITDVRDMLRSGEEEYTTYDLANTSKTQDEIIEVVLANRILIQRPIVVKDDLVEAIVGLPEKLFYNTGIPASIIIINKSKAQNLKNKVVFIDASVGNEPLDLLFLLRFIIGDSRVQTDGLEH